MRRWTTGWMLSALLLLTGLTFSPAGALPPPRVFEDNPEMMARMKEYARNAFAQPQRSELDADTSHTYDTIELAVFLAPDLDQGNCSTSVDLKVVLLEDVPTIPVYLAECDIDCVLINGVAESYTYDENEVTIDLPDDIAVSDTILVSVLYTSQIRSDLFFGGLIYNENYDNLFTFGEPYETRYWLACYDYPYDKIDTTLVAVEMDSSYHVLSNGEQVMRSDIGDGIAQTIWMNTDPIASYLISISAKPYVYIEDGTYGVNDTPVNFWVSAEHQEIAEYEFGRTGQMIEEFENIFTPYPFNKYDQAMSAIFSGWGAMEHQTATTYGANLVLMGDRRFEDIVAHELAHMWFGDLVTPMTFANMWLNEGWASISEALWHELLDDGGEGEVYAGFRTAYFNEDETFRYAMYNPPLDYIFGRVIYDKGALVLRMLRYVIGPDAFWEGTQSYLEEYAYGNVVTNEFIQHMEDACGYELDWFFDQWVYDAGHPEFIVGGLTTEAEGGDTWSASLEIQQVQENAPLFQMPVPVRFRLGATDTLMRVDVQALGSQTVTVSGIEFEPTSFNFNPGDTVLCQVSYNGVYEHGDHPLPTEFSVSNPYPNPFNSSTRVEVKVPQAGELTIKVFDTLGRTVATLHEGVVYRGGYDYVWVAPPELASGVYYIRAEGNRFSPVTRTVHLVK